MYVSQAEKIFATHSNYTTHSLDSAAPKGNTREGAFAWQRTDKSIVREARLKPAPAT